MNGAFAVSSQTPGEASAPSAMEFKETEVQKATLAEAAFEFYRESGTTNDTTILLVTI